MKKIVLRIGALAPVDAARRKCLEETFGPEVIVLEKKISFSGGAVRNVQAFIRRSRESGKVVALEVLAGAEASFKKLVEGQETLGVLMLQAQFYKGAKSQPTSRFQDYVVIEAILPNGELRTRLTNKVGANSSTSW